MRASMNDMDVANCPSCDQLLFKCTSGGLKVRCPCCAGKSFCWDCKRSWVGDNTCGNKGCSSGTGPITEIVSILKNCNSGSIGSVTVPKLRACPKCSMLIEHKAACKHMTCGRNGHAGPWVKKTGCKHQFCFICLKDWNGHSSSTCQPHPAQTIATLPSSAWDLHNQKKSIRVPDLC